MRKLLFVLFAFVFISCGSSSLVGSHRIDVMESLGQPVISTEQDGYLVETYLEAIPISYMMPGMPFAVGKVKYRKYKVWYENDIAVRVQ